MQSIRNGLRSSLDREEILSFARMLLRCEVLNEPVPTSKLCGLTPEELRSHSHRPQDYYGLPHFMPSAKDGQLILRLNRARCAAREAELRAVAAFSDKDGNPVRTDILKMLNSFIYLIRVLMVHILQLLIHVYGGINILLKILLIYAFGLIL
jgi:ethanolamine utilization cobalamin adenosyltransferase